MTSAVADFVVAMGSDGRISSQGTMSDVLATDKHLRKLVAAGKQEEDRANEEIDSSSPEVPKDEDAGKLIVEEETAVGHLSWSSSESMVFTRA